MTARNAWPKIGKRRGIPRIPVVDRPDAAFAFEWSRAAARGYRYFDAEKSAAFSAEAAARRAKLRSKK
jgi:hypothetical protein